MSVTFEQQLIKNLVNTNAYFGGPSKRTFQKNPGFLLGLKKGFVLYNLEKAVFTYIKVLGLIKSFKKQKLKILFIGCPFGMEKKIENLLLPSRHFFISSKSWVQGSLSNNTNLFRELALVITFNQNLVFSKKELFNKEVAVVSFSEEIEKISSVDFPLVVNLQSKGVTDMYYYLLKQSF